MGQIHARTRNLCYNRQCQDTGGVYLADLVPLTSDPKIYPDVAFFQFIDYRFEIT